MGALLPKVVWPSDVDAYKSQNAGQFDATNAVISACASLDPTTKQAWVSFYQSWQSFNATKTPLFGAANAMDQAEADVETLSQWQTNIAARGCALSGPPVTPPSAATSTELDAMKWIVGGVVVVALVYGVTRVIR
jgi:hypothetical protein